MTEQQPYDVVEQHQGFEVRRYPEHLVAEVELTGSFEGVGNRAFGPLAAYIGGRNSSQAKVAMTAPVVQSGTGGATSGERIAMTAPVVQSGDADSATGGRYTVSFVMPTGYTLETLPTPTDPRVTVRSVPEELAAAVRYSGRWTRGGFEQRRDRLVADVVAAGYVVTGPERWARFDPPWTPWFLRRQEVVVPVRRP